MITITIEGSADHIRQEVGRLLGLNTGPSESQWEKLFQRSNEPPARTVAEDPDTTVTEGAGDVRDEIVAEPEQPRRGRGRPRKNPVTIDGESTLVSETVTPASAEPEQIDIEAALCSECGEPQFETPSGATCANGHGGAAAQTEPAARRSQPLDGKNWTHDDAKTVARAMYVRLGTLQQHELDEKLHTNLQKFGVQRIKDLALEQIEAFVRAVEAEVA